MGTKGWIAVGLAVVVALGVALVALPAYVKGRVVDVAAEQGVTLTIGSAQLAWGEVHLGDVTFALPEVPQLRAKAPDVEVTLSGLTPTRVEARGLEVAIDGAADALMTAVDRWRAAHAPKPQGDAGAEEAPAASAPKVTVASGHVAWTRAFGLTGSIDASDLAGDADPAAGAVRLTSDKTTVGTPRGSYGPWRVTFESDPKQTRTRVELDPALHDAATALYVHTPDGASTLSVNVPKSPLAQIGVPPANLGLPASSPAQVEAAFTLARAPTRAELKGHGSLFHAQLGGAPVPVDARMDLEAAGDPSKPLDVSKGSLTVGPFRATVRGTVALYPDGARLALAWTAVPIPCAQVGQEITRDTLGETAAALGALAQANLAKLGLAKVTGEARASGLLTVDTRNLGETAFTMTANDTCGVTIFP